MLLRESISPAKDLTAFSRALFCLPLSNVLLTLVFQLWRELERMAGRSLRRECELLWTRYLTAAQEVLGCSDIGELDLSTYPLFVLPPPPCCEGSHVYTHR